MTARLTLRSLCRATATSGPKPRGFASMPATMSSDDDVAEGQRFDIFNPTPEHAQLREMVRAFAENEVSPQVCICSVRCWQRAWTPRIALYYATNNW